MPRKTKPVRIERKYSPETLMMSLGYDPTRSEGAVKPPIFPVSTYAFPNVAAGKKAFQQAIGNIKKTPKDALLYGRFNHPDMQIFEERLAACEGKGAEACAAFSSGMAAIFSTLFAFLKPGEIVLHSDPLYGGSDGLLKKLLFDRMDISSIGFTHKECSQEILEKVHSFQKTTGPRRVSAILVETPANPTNALFSLAICKFLKRHFDVPLIVDNTFLGPLFQKPLEHGADIVAYSCTKYIGGHSDLIAGACLGSSPLIEKIRKVRGMTGDMLDPFTAWQLLSRLETLHIRMERQNQSALKIAKFLKNHEKISHVYYPGLLDYRIPASQLSIYLAQCTGGGGVISFDVAGGGSAAETFLDELARTEIVKLAVSLGSTESLAQLPYSMTHAGVDAEAKKRLDITEAMVRLSIGLEKVDDLIYVLDESLKKV